MKFQHSFYGDLETKSPEIKFFCSRHGAFSYSHLFFAGIVLRCGCSWKSIHEKGLIYDGQFKWPNRKVGKKP